jgi:hypothetical protein
MKKLLGLILFIATLSSVMATEINLDPGSRITISASETTTVSCSGSSSSSSSEKSCRVLTYQQAQQEGYERYCYSSYRYCAVVIQYGQAINGTYNSNTNKLAQWCDGQL